MLPSNIFKRGKAEIQTELQKNQVDMKTIEEQLSIQEKVVE